MAVAHRLLVIAYHVIARREPYRERGGDYLERRRPAALADRLLHRLQQPGGEVSVVGEAHRGAAPAGGVLATTG